MQLYWPALRNPTPWFGLLTAPFHQSTEQKTKINLAIDWERQVSSFSWKNIQRELLFRNIQAEEKSTDLKMD